MVYKLQTGEPHPDSPAKIADLQRQAHYYDSLTEQATRTEVRGITFITCARHTTVKGKSLAIQT